MDMAEFFFLAEFFFFCKAKFINEQISVWTVNILEYVIAGLGFLAEQEAF